MPDAMDETDRRPERRTRSWGRTIVNPDRDGHLSTARCIWMKDRRETVMTTKEGAAIDGFIYERKLLCVAQAET